MKNIMKMAIVVIVAALVISTGLLYATGYLNLNNNKSTPTYSSSSPQYNSPNVVSSNQVNNSLGGSWNQTSGSTATANNASAGIAIIEGAGGSYYSSSTSVPLNTYIMPGYNQIVGKMPFISLQGSNAQSLSVNPSLSAPTSNSPALSGITSLEFAVFQPTSGVGIATVGYISERNVSEVTHIWSLMNASAKNSTKNNVSMGMTSSGTPYIYGFFESNTLKSLSSTFNATGMYVNIMISVYSNHLIMVLHLASVNETKNAILTLMNSEVAILKNPSSAPSHPIFITSAQIKGQTGVNETNFLQVDINIQNASTIYKEFVNTSNATTTSSESVYMGEAMSNISAIAFSTYGDNHGNGTLIGLLKFNNNFNTTLFNGILALSSHYSQFINSTYNGSRYIFVSVNTSTSTPTGMEHLNISMMFFDYKSYIGLVEIIDQNGKLVNQAGMKVLLGDEISLL